MATATQADAASVGSSTLVPPPRTDSKSVTMTTSSRSPTPERNPVRELEDMLESMLASSASGEWADSLSSSSSAAAPELDALHSEMRRVSAEVRNLEALLHHTPATPLPADVDPALLAAVSRARLLADPHAELSRLIEQKRRALRRLSYSAVAAQIRIRHHKRPVPASPPQMRTLEKRRAILAAKRRFNGTPTASGIEQLHLPLEDIPRFLASEPGITKAAVGAFLAQTQHADHLARFLDIVDVRGLSLEQSIRRTLSTLAVPDEAVAAARIAHAIASAWFHSPPLPQREGWWTLEAAGLVAEATIALDAAIHAPGYHGPTAPTRKAFVQRLAPRLVRSTTSKRSVHAYLKELYTSITNTPFPHHHNEDLTTWYTEEERMLDRQAVVMVNATAIPPDAESVVESRPLPPTPQILPTPQTSQCESIASTQSDINILKRNSSRDSFGPMSYAWRALKSRFRATKA